MSDIHIAEMRRTAIAIIAQRIEMARDETRAIQHAEASGRAYGAISLAWQLDLITEGERSEFIYKLDGH